MKRYIRSSIDTEEIFQIARTTSDMQELYDLLDNKEVRYMYFSDVCREIAKNPNLTDDFIEYVVSVPVDTKPEYSTLRYYLMESPLVGTDILKTMVYSDDYTMRAHAARSPYLTTDMMKHLAKDRSSHGIVPSILAENPKLPEYLMRDMYHENLVNRYYLARNPNAPLDLLEEILEDKDSDSDTRKAARKAIKQRTGKDLSKRKSPWMTLLDELQSEAEDGIDSLYEQTSAGDEIESLCAAVQRKLSVWLEPSIQGGMGSIMFYSTKDDSVLADDYDYQEYNEEVLHLAFNSKTQREFQTKYKQFLQSIIA